MAYYDDYYGPTTMSRRPSYGGGVPFPTYDYPEVSNAHNHQANVPLASGTTTVPQQTQANRHRRKQSFGDERYPPFPSRRNSLRSVHYACESLISSYSTNIGRPGIDNFLVSPYICAV